MFSSTSRVALITATLALVGAPALADVPREDNAHPNAVHAPAIPGEPRVGATVVGGHAATEPVPFIAALHTGDQFTCTASLVAAHWILTAAHCVDAADLNVRVGSLTRSSGGETAAVTETVTEPSGSDVALLRIDKDIQAEYPVLGSPGDAETGTQERVYGWGYTRSDWTELSEVLKYSEGSIEDADCDVLGASLCMKNDGDTSGGDSGGPMLATGDGQNKLIGTCTAGHKPTDGTGFGAYTDITLYRDWIDQTISG